MIRFQFRGNRSFVEGAGHPITVPKSQVPYHLLEARIGSAREGRMTLPDGSHVGVHLYEGTAGYGPYFQLRTRSPSPWIRDCAKVGDSFEIFLELRAGRLEVSARAR